MYGDPKCALCGHTESDHRMTLQNPAGHVTPFGWCGCTKFLPNSQRRLVNAIPLAKELLDIQMDSADDAIALLDNTLTERQRSLVADAIRFLAGDAE